ncbi:MAG TPA: PASTA domain-containing protein, partial [Candidatus Avimonas sp.]|nr:PASTA domain-containing protein [Candidatus Avimonas sp.]
TSKFEIEKHDVYMEDQPKYQIVDQEPKSPKTVKYKTKIILTVNMGPKLITIPDVSKNEHMDVVKERLESAGFEVQIAYQTSNDVKKDFVIKIDPPSGEELAKGSVITMYVSSGEELPDPEPVPYVVYTNIESAKAMIKQSGFNVGTIEYVNSDYPKDVVISQDPPKDTMATPGTKINLKVASGFKDFKLTVPLPRTTAALDMCVYVDDFRVEKFDKNDFIPSSSLDLLLTTQKEQYPVIIKLRKHGETEWRSYMRFEINCLQQRIVNEEKLADDSLFYESTGTTTTNPTPSDVYDPGF